MTFDLIRAGIRLKDSSARQGVQARLSSVPADRRGDRRVVSGVEAIGDHLDALDEPAAIENMHTAFGELHVVPARAADASPGQLAAPRCDQRVRDRI